MDKLPKIQDQKLRLRALTHRSYVNEHPQEGKDNERLEFLGDAVLGFIVGELLYHYQSQELSEAQMTRLRAALVDEQQLGKFAALLGMGEIMRLGKGAIRDGGYQNPALLSDTFEAYIGAYYLDAGLEKVKEFITPLFKKVADEILGGRAEEKNSESLIDSKNRFQQWALAEFGENPKYVIVDQSGPDHAKEFIAEVRVKDKIYGAGKGRRKQDAQKKAAEAALKKLGIV